jgi:hypothetical protein
MQDIGCPLAADSKQRFQFETLLSELSAKFINVSADQVDSQIKWGLQRIVELLGIDRSGLGQVSADRKQIVVTHSYELPGIPPSAGFMLDSRFPYFAKMVHQGAVIRLPVNWHLKRYHLFALQTVPFYVDEWTSGKLVLFDTLFFDIGPGWRFGTF